MGSIQLEDSLLYDGLLCAMEGYHMGITAENLAQQYKISREEQDQFSVNSQNKAINAIQKVYLKMKLFLLKWVHLNGLKRMNIHVKQQWKL